MISACLLSVLVHVASKSSGPVLQRQHCQTRDPCWMLISSRMHMRSACQPFCCLHWWWLTLSLWMQCPGGHKDAFVPNEARGGDEFQADAPNCWCCGYEADEPHGSAAAASDPPDLAAGIQSAPVTATPQLHASQTTQTAPQASPLSQHSCRAAFERFVYLLHWVTCGIP